MPHVNIFISYRRDDAAGHAGRLCDRLEEYFPGCVFMDVTGIAPGADFVHALDQKLGACQVLIVVIGKSWLSIMQERDGGGEPDHARAEVVTALRKGVTIIPVLVQGARMPSPGQLPADLKPLANRNALEITEPDFRSDVRRLADAITQLYAPPKPPKPPPIDFTPPPRAGLPMWAKLFLGLSATVIVGVVLIFGIIAANVSSDNERRPTDFNGVTDEHGFVPTPPRGGGGPKQKVTPEPTPQQDGGGEPSQPDADYFSPPGTWLVIIRTQNGPVSGTYRLYPNNRVEFSVGPSQGGGTWVYDEEESALIISGMNTFGTAFTETFQVGRRQGNAYQIQHMALGPGTMTRVQ